MSENQNTSIHLAGATLEIELATDKSIKTHVPLHLITISDFLLFWAGAFVFLIFSNRFVVMYWYALDLFT